MDGGGILDSLWNQGRFARAERAQRGAGNTMSVVQPVRQPERRRREEVETAPEAEPGPEEAAVAEAEVEKASSKEWAETNSCSLPNRR